MSDRQRFNLHLPGLLKVLAEHLYTSKKVGIRELIQNAHDSCTRRMIEAGERAYTPRIDVADGPLVRPTSPTAGHPPGNHDRDHEQESASGHGEPEKGGHPGHA